MACPVYIEVPEKVCQCTCLLVERIGAGTSILFVKTLGSFPGGGMVDNLCHDELMKVSLVVGFLLSNISHIVTNLAATASERRSALKKILSVMSD